MSIPMIETGYKPQFSLGALYQGFNAGSADNAAQLANLAKEWELQKSRAEDPYKVLSSMYQGNLDNAKMQDPNYIPWQLAGQVGQMQTQEAAGRKAQALSESDIAAAKQENKNKLISGELDYKTYQEQNRMFDELLAGGGQQPQGKIAFPMYPQQEQQGSIGFQTSLPAGAGNEGRSVPNPKFGPVDPRLAGVVEKMESGGRDLNADGTPLSNPNSSALGRMQVVKGTRTNPGFGVIPAKDNSPEELTRVGRDYLSAMRARYGDDAKALAAYHDGPGALDKAMQAGGEAWFDHLSPEGKKYVENGISALNGGETTSTSTQVASAGTPGSTGNKPTLYSDLIPKTSVLAKMAGVRALDPKFVGEMSKLEQKTDSAEDIAVMRAQQLREAAAAKTHITEPKYKEQLAQHQNNMAEYNYMVSQGQPISAEVYKKAYQSNEWLRTHEQMLQIANPANFQPKMDMGAMGVPQRPAPVQQANTNRPSLDAVQGSPAGTPNVIKYDKQGNRIQ